MPEIKIRELKPSEIEEAVSVWGRSWRHAVPWLADRTGHTPEDDLRHFRETFAENADNWVAVQEGRIVGLLTLRGSHLELLYVEPSEHRRGIGSELLEHAMAHSPTGLTLYTHRDNLPARRFYEHYGFQAIAFGVSPAPESEPDVKYRWCPDEPELD